MSKELTARQKQSVKRLVKNYCANYSKEHGCLPLDSECYMFTKHFANDKICKYFRESILPLDPELAAVFFDKKLKSCSYCGKKFEVKGRKTYCSDSCREKAQKEQNAKRVRKHREKKEGER